MADVLLFGGTTEGRELTKSLFQYGISSVVSVATGYGGELLKEQIEGLNDEKNGCISVRTGRLDRKKIVELIKKEDVRLVIDATHPFAAEATAEIGGACEETRVPCLRCLRAVSQEARGEEAEYFPSVKAAVDWLQNRSGNILVSTGSKELSAFTELSDYQTRIYARVLPLPKVLEACRQLGFPTSHIIGMQGPFSEEMNRAMLREFDCRYLVTKESGNAGGLAEKLQAAKALGVKALVIQKPEEEGLSLEAIEEKLRTMFQKGEGQ